MHSCAQNSRSQGPSQSSSTCSRSSWGSINPVLIFRLFKCESDTLHSSTPGNTRQILDMSSWSSPCLPGVVREAAPCYMVERRLGTHSSLTALSLKSLHFVISPKSSIPSTSPNTEAGKGVGPVQAEMCSHPWKHISLARGIPKDYCVAPDLWVLWENRKHPI